jgi:molecular chaperone GrpE
VNSEIDKREPGPASAGPSQADGAQVTDPADALATMTAERDTLAAEKAGLEDRFLRLQAEFQNQRRRGEKEKMEWHEYAAAEAVRALLPILDDFERALKVESADKDYTRGMELIYQRLYDALKKLGLEPINSLGQPFDPNIHHAVDRKESAEADDTVIEEYQRGYNFKGRMLRPAMVVVAVTPVSKAD